MKQNLLAKIFVSWLCASLAINVFGVEQSPVDRLIVEVNGVHYTQKQMESYIFFRSLLSEFRLVEKVDAANWEKQLMAFESLILMEQEAYRLGGYQPSEVILQKSSELIHSKIKNDPDLSLYYRELDINVFAENRALQNILRIEGFRRSRVTRANSQSGSGDGLAPSSSKVEDQSLISELRGRAILRHYEGAKEYVKLGSFPN